MHQAGQERVWPSCRERRCRIYMSCVHEWGKDSTTSKDELGSKIN